MKLSAPPPPPPEPGPQPNPLPPEPHPPAEASSAPPTTSPSAGRVAAWPTWFAGADLLLGVLTLAIAFLAASFAAHNSDFWRHLAAGQRLTTGDYHLGSDPFSYTGADRTWVNHSWLFDLGVYFLYQGDGFRLVLIKAIGVAAAFALLLGMRRPGYALWPWTVFVVLGVLAAADQLLLRPQVLSFVFLALTLLLVFRMPNRAGSWRLPIAIGITFCVWSNCDEWFFLGPMALLLLIVGEAVRRSLGGAAAEETTDPLGPLPDLGTLLRTLVVGAIACMVNPHHVGVWELPFALIGAPAGVDTDSRITWMLTSPLYHGSTLSAFFWTNNRFGSNVNGLAYAILLASGLYAAFLSGAVGRLLGRAAEVEPLPLPHTFLWIGFAILSLLTIYAIPFFAAVTIPLVASRWNVFSGRLALGSSSEGRTRLLITLSALGRIAFGAALLGLGIAAWPGKLHAPASCWWDSRGDNPANARRVAWIIEPEVEWRRAAEWLQRQRSEGRLSAEARGFLASIEFADYCAWFAPSEKVFANGRWNFHRRELAEFVEIRRGLGVFGGQADALERQNAVDSLGRWQAAYVGIATFSSERPIFALPTLSDMWLDSAHWSPWWFNGRTAISGWRESPARADSSFSRLTVNPVDLAYGPDTAMLPVPNTHQPNVARNEWEEFILPPRPAPAGVDESLIWQLYKDFARRKNSETWNMLSVLRLIQPGLAAPPVASAQIAFMNEFFLRQGQSLAPKPVDGSFEAMAILSLRAARRAIAENPDHPDGYYVLASALVDSDLPITEAERYIERVTAYRQCLSRLPPPSEFQPGRYRAWPTNVALELAELYVKRHFYPNGQPRFNRGILVNVAGIRELVGEYEFFRGGNRVQSHRPPAGEGWTTIRDQPPMLWPLDLGREMFETALKYGIAGFNPGLLNNVSPEQFAKELERRRDRFTSEFDASVRQLRTAAERPGARPRDRYRLALHYHLVGEAINVFHANRENLQEEFGPDAIPTALQVVALELAVGRLEDAIDDLVWVSVRIDGEANQPKSDPNRNRSNVALFSALMYRKLVLEGDYEGAGKELERLEGRDIEAIRNQKIPTPNEAIAIPIVLPPINASGAEVAAMLFRFHWESGYEGAQARLLSQLARVQDFFFRRGYLSLVAGDIAGAKKRFEEVPRKAVPVWKIPAYTLPAAPTYLRGIERARRDSPR